MPAPALSHPPIRAPLGDVSTERLRLRRFRPDDVDALAAVFAKPEVWKFPYGRGFDREETAAFLTAQIEAWDACRFGLWLAAERASNRVIGYLGLCVPTFLPEILPAVEVGWRLDPEVWGRGYASEGARAALSAGFTTLGLPEICSLPQKENPASARVCQRIGMPLEREITIPANERRGAVTALLYRLTQAQWPGAPGD